MYLYVYIYIYFLFDVVCISVLPLVIASGIVVGFVLFLDLSHVVAMSRLRAVAATVSVVAVDVSVSAVAAPEVIGSKINRA